MGATRRISSRSIEKMLARSVRVAFLAGRPSFCTAASSVKATTNLVGLEVQKDAPKVLTELYAKTLEDVKALPADAEYRVNVEKITNYRLKVVQEKELIDDIESVMGLQVEEMIVEAEDELKLIPQMLDWKPWENK